LRCCSAPPACQRLIALEKISEPIGVQRDSYFHFSKSILRCEAMISSKAGSGVQRPTKSEKSAFGLRPPVTAASSSKITWLRLLRALCGLPAEYRVDLARHTSNRVLNLACLSLQACMIARRAGPQAAEAMSRRRRQSDTLQTPIGTFRKPCFRSLHTKNSTHKSDLLERRL
jgi:hypothetical protein